MFWLPGPSRLHSGADLSHQTASGSVLRPKSQSAGTALLLWTAPGTAPVLTPSAWRGGGGG